AIVGAVTPTVIRTRWPGAVSGIGTRCGVLQSAGPTGHSSRCRNRPRQASAPEFSISHTFVNVSPTLTVLPSGMVTSLMNLLASPGYSGPAGLLLVAGVLGACACAPGSVTSTTVTAVAATSSTAPPTAAVTILPVDQDGLPG